MEQQRLNWSCCIRDMIYKITFSADMADVSDGPIFIMRMYGLEKDGFTYVLAILSNGTYRLYSKAQKKLYIKGRIAAIRWIPHVSKEVH